MIRPAVSVAFAIVSRSGRPTGGRPSHWRRRPILSARRSHPRSHEEEGMVAIGRVVLSTREHIIALEARDAGMLGMLLHYPYEVRKPEEYFEDMPEVDTPKEMIGLATHIIETMAGHFDPAKFEDRYE